MNKLPTEIYIDTLSRALKLEPRINPWDRRSHAALSTPSLQITRLAQIVATFGCSFLSPAVRWLVTTTSRKEPAEMKIVLRKYLSHRHEDSCERKIWRCSQLHVLLEVVESLKQSWIYTEIEHVLSEQSKSGKPLLNWRDGAGCRFLSFQESEERTLFRCLLLRFDWKGQLACVHHIAKGEERTTLKLLREFKNLLKPAPIAATSQRIQNFIEIGSVAFFKQFVTEGERMNDETKRDIQEFLGQCTSCEFGSVKMFEYFEEAHIHATGPAWYRWNDIEKIAEYLREKSLTQFLDIREFLLSVLDVSDDDFLHLSTVARLAELDINVEWGHGKSELIVSHLFAQGETCEMWTQIPKCYERLSWLDLDPSNTYLLSRTLHTRAVQITRSTPLTID